MSVNQLFSANNFTTYSNQSITNDLQLGNVQIKNDTLQPINTNFTSSQLVAALNGIPPIAGNITGNISANFIPICTSNDFISNSQMQIIGNTLLTGVNVTVNGGLFVGDQFHAASTSLFDSTVTISGATTISQTTNLNNLVNFAGPINYNTNNALSSGYPNFQPISEYLFISSFPSGLSQSFSFTAPYPTGKTVASLRKLRAAVFINNSFWNDNEQQSQGQNFSISADSNNINLTTSSFWSTGNAATFYIYISCV